MTNIFAIEMHESLIWSRQVFSTAQQRTQIVLNELKVACAIGHDWLYDDRSRGVCLEIESLG